MSENRNAVRHGAATRELIDPLVHERPELLPWLRPLGVALQAAAQEPWCSLVPVRATRHESAPLLHGAVVPVPGAAIDSFVAAILEATFDRVAPGSIDARQLIEAAVRQDDDALDALAVGAGLDAARLGAAAQLATLPLLHACARSLAPGVRTDWREHYCHVCGMLPLLVEVLGLDRARQLRCGRCGSAWGTHVLLCPYCGEHDHGQLGSLVPDGAAGQVCWIETCSTCHGYWKARAVLRPAPSGALLLEDARSLELDVIANDRGYARPTHGFRTRIRISTVPVAEAIHE